MAEEVEINGELTPDREVWSSLAQDTRILELNPKFFDQEDKLKPEVRDVILRIVSDVISDLKDKKFDLIPVFTVLVGSLTGPDFDDQSDVDIHIGIDFSKFEDPNIVRDFLRYYARVFNANNYTLLDHKIEIYFQGSDEVNLSPGVYDVNSDSWTAVGQVGSVRHEIPQEVMDKAEEFLKRIETKEQLLKEGMPRDQLDPFLTDVINLLHEIMDMRKESISGKDVTSILSIGNQAFKQLRRNGGIPRLVKLIRDIRDQIYDVPVIGDVVEGTVRVEGLMQDVRRGDAPVLIDPDRSEIMDYLRTTKYNKLRALLTKDFLYVFDANEMSHLQVADRLGLDLNRLVGMEIVGEGPSFYATYDEVKNLGGKGSVKSHRSIKRLGKHRMIMDESVINTDDAERFEVSVSSEYDAEDIIEWLLSHSYKPDMDVPPSHREILKAIHRKKLAGLRFNNGDKYAIVIHGPKGWMVLADNLTGNSIYELMHQNESLKESHMNEGAVKNWIHNQIDQALADAGLTPDAPKFDQIFDRAFENVMQLRKFDPSLIKGAVNMAIRAMTEAKERIDAGPPYSSSQDGNHWWVVDKDNNVIVGVYKTKAAADDEADRRNRGIKPKFSEIESVLDKSVDDLLGNVNESVKYLDCDVCGKPAHFEGKIIGNGIGKLCDDCKNALTDRDGKDVKVIDPIEETEEDMEDMTCDLCGKKYSPTEMDYVKEKSNGRGYWVCPLCKGNPESSWNKNESKDRYFKCEDCGYHEDIPESSSASNIKKCPQCGSTHLKVNESDGVNDMFFQTLDILKHDLLYQDIDVHEHPAGLRVNVKGKDWFIKLNTFGEFVLRDNAGHPVYVTRFKNKMVDYLYRVTESVDESRFQDPTIPRLEQDLEYMDFAVITNRPGGGLYVRPIGGGYYELIYDVMKGHWIVWNNARIVLQGDSDKVLEYMEKVKEQDIATSSKFSMAMADSVLNGGDIKDVLNEDKMKIGRCDRCGYEKEVVGDIENVKSVDKYCPECKRTTTFNLTPSWSSSDKWQKPKRESVLRESRWTRYASTDEQEDSISKLERTLSGLGKKIVGGVTIGKSPQTVILDLTYQKGEIYVNPDGEVEVNGMNVDPADEESVSSALRGPGPEGDDDPDPRTDEAASTNPYKAKKITKTVESDPDRWSVYDTSKDPEEVVDGPYDLQADADAAAERKWNQRTGLKDSLLDPNVSVDALLSERLDPETVQREIENLIEFHHGSVRVNKMHNPDVRSITGIFEDNKDYKKCMEDAEDDLPRWVQINPDGMHIDNNYYVSFRWHAPTNESEDEFDETDAVRFAKEGATVDQIKKAMNGKKPRTKKELVDLLKSANLYNEAVSAPAGIDIDDQVMILVNSRLAERAVKVPVKVTGFYEPTQMWTGIAMRSVGEIREGDKLVFEDRDVLQLESVRTPDVRSQLNKLTKYIVRTEGEIKNQLVNLKEGLDKDPSRLFEITEKLNILMESIPKSVTIDPISGSNSLVINESEIPTWRWLLDHNDPSANAFNVAKAGVEIREIKDSEWTVNESKYRREDIEKAVDKLDPVILEDRPAETANVIQRIKQSNVFEKLVRAHYTGSGSVALFRDKDGQSYELQVRPAKLAQYGDTLGTLKKDRRR